MRDAPREQLLETIEYLHEEIRILRSCLDMTPREAQALVDSHRKEGKT